MECQKIFKSKFIPSHLFSGGKKGLSLYLAIIIFTMISGVGLGIAAILLNQLKTIKGLENSVAAFYAADTGIERILLSRQDVPANVSDALLLPDGTTASYQVTVTAGGAGTCPASLNYCIKSVGGYKETKRAIEITY